MMKHPFAIYYSGDPIQKDVGSMFHAGGCNCELKACYWTGSLWRAFRESFRRP